MSYRNLVPDDWQEALSRSQGWVALDSIEEYVRSERDRWRVFPRDADVFNALKLTPIGEVRAVILGMDPYHRPGQANGLAFSVTPGSKPFPSSLRSILDELERDLGHPVNRDGDLSTWATSGVLLLNAALTVREGSPRSHLFAWTAFTDAVISSVQHRPGAIAFMLWGKQAELRRSLIAADRHVVQIRSHPSGLSAHRNFSGTFPFRSINEGLAAKARSPIDWDLPIRHASTSTISLD